MNRKNILILLVIVSLALVVVGCTKTIEESQSQKDGEDMQEIPEPSTETHVVTDPSSDANKGNSDESVLVVEEAAVEDTYDSDLGLDSEDDLDLGTFEI